MAEQLGSLVPFLLMLGIFYFLLIRPQIKEQQEHDDLVASLVKGEQVVTKSGLHGKIVSVSEETVVLEIAKNARVTLDKVAVVRKLADGKQG